MPAYHKGWKLDRDNSRLNAVYNDDPSFYIDANGATVPSGETLTISGTLTASGGTVTLPTRTAFFDDEHAFVAADGAALALSETAGDFFRDIGTNQWLIRGEATINETETSVGFFTFTLPENYVAGGTVTLRAVADIVLAGDAVLTSATIDMEAFKQTDATGAIGSDLVTTAATAVTTTGGAKDFTVTPTGLVAGDKFIVKVTGTVIEEAAGTGAAHMLITKIGHEVQVDK